MSRTKLDPAFEAAVCRSPDVERVLRQQAEEIAARARSEISGRSSSVAAGIRVVTGLDNGRMVARVIATDFKSHWFQFGTVKMRAHPYLDVAAMALGYTIQARTRG